MLQTQQKIPLPLYKMTAFGTQHLLYTDIPGLCLVHKSVVDNLAKQRHVFVPQSFNYAIVVPRPAQGNSTLYSNCFSTFEYIGHNHTLAILPYVYQKIFFFFFLAVVWTKITSTAILRLPQNRGNLNAAVDENFNLSFQTSKMRECGQPHSDHNLVKYLTNSAEHVKNSVTLKLIKGCFTTTKKLTQCSCYVLDKHALCLFAGGWSYYNARAWSGDS